MSNGFEFTKTLNKVLKERFNMSSNVKKEFLDLGRHPIL